MQSSNFFSSAISKAVFPSLFSKETRIFTLFTKKIENLEEATFDKLFLFKCWQDSMLS